MLLKLITAGLMTGYMQEVAEATQGASAAASTKKKEKVRIKVQMKDGREQEFPEDTKAKKDWIYKDAQGNITVEPEAKAENGQVTSHGKPIGVRWDFSNGETRTVLVSDVAALAEEFTCHGISQKCGDEYASEKDVDDAVMAFDDLLDRLKKGEWSERGGGGGFGGASILAKAISEVFGKTMDEVRAFLRDLKPAEKLALRQTPELKPTIEKLEAEKAQGTKVDTASLLAKAKAFSAPAAAQQ